MLTILIYLLLPRLSFNPTSGVEPEELALRLLVGDGLLGPVRRATHEARHGRALHGCRLVLDRHSALTRSLRNDSKIIGSSQRRSVEANSTHSQINHPQFV